MLEISVAVGWMLLCLLTAQSLAPKNYHWLYNTLSQLGAQKYEHAWIMRTGLIGFGILISIAASRHFYTHHKHWSLNIFLLAYGLSMLVTGFFSTSPLLAHLTYSQTEATIHSVGANLAGVFFTGTMLTALLIDTSKNRLFHLLSLIFVITTSALFKRYPEYQGLWQRLLWSGSFVWLIYHFS